MVWNVPKIITFWLVVILIWCVGFLFGMGAGLDRATKKYCESNNQDPMAYDECMDGLSR